MNFKEKILSKSNSYNYYKENNENLLKEIEFLKEEIRILKFDKQFDLNEEFLKIYDDATSFCNSKFFDYFLRDDFEDKLKEVTRNLDDESKKTFKLLFLRVLFINLIKKDSLYFSDELNDQSIFRGFEKNYLSKNRIDTFQFFGEYNIHSFIDLKLSENDKKFIKNKDIIDAGAFTGDTSLPLSKITNKKVYAFEPFGDSFNLLKKNIESNNIKNIIPINKSLGNKNGERTLFLAGNNIQGITSISNLRDYDTEIKVQETTIDKFVEENNLDVGYIYIDVEGAEMDLLNGAINTINSQKPILRISIYHSVSDFFDIIPWISNLDLGYEFNVFKEQPWPFLADTVVHCCIKEKNIL